MDKMKIDEKTERCIEFIKGLKSPVETNHLAFYFWKSTIVIGNYDTFHRLAQTLGVGELSFVSSLHFDLKVPNKTIDDYIDDSWTVALGGGGEAVRQFVQKYGGYYKIQYH